MLDLVTNTIAALQAETALYPHAVQIWMKVMGLSFLVSLVFVRSKTGARWIFAALMLGIEGQVLNSEFQFRVCCTHRITLQDLTPPRGRNGSSAS